jgi:hypothetical protein
MLAMLVPRQAVNMSSQLSAFSNSVAMAAAATTTPMTITAPAISGAARMQSPTPKVAASA